MLPIYYIPTLKGGGERGKQNCEVTGKKERYFPPCLSVSAHIVVVTTTTTSTTIGGPIVVVSGIIIGLLTSELIVIVVIVANRPATHLSHTYIHIIHTCLSQNITC